MTSINCTLADIFVSEHVELPLLLVDVDKEEKYKIFEENYFFTDCNFEALKNAALKQSKPTVMSVLYENSTNLFYIITPVFLFKNNRFFVAAGPCLLQSNNLLDTTQNEIVILNEEDLEDRLNKIRNLYFLLANKQSVETKQAMPKQVINMLQKVEKLDYNIIDSDAYFYRNLDEFLTIDSIDFIGIANKNESDIFVVDYINGENVQHLLGKKFYMGEGLLGSAAILGEDFYWEKNKNTRKPEFLNRYGIYPNYLFGFILQNNDEVEDILFGGSFQEKFLCENTLELIKFIINYLVQKRQIKTKLLDTEYIQSIFISLLELINITLYAKENKYISYKILDFCQTINKRKFVCMTSSDNTFTFRGNMKNEILQCHQNALDILNQKSNKVWIDGYCIHFYEEHYGLFTVEFDKNTDLNYVSYILEMIMKLFGQNNSLNETEDEFKDSIFQILFTSMREMNPRQYDLSKRSLKFAKSIGEKLELTKERLNMILNLCKVLPYSIDYLKEHIIHTEEWDLLCHTNDLIQENVHSSLYNIECQIVAFIYKMIVRREDIEKVNNIQQELKELFLQEYSSLFSSDEHIIDELQIEEMTDLKGVISTLTLTRREKEILYLILEGLNNHEVGEYLKISVHTVKNHVTNIFKKLNVSDRFQAMAKIYRIKYGEGY